MQLQGYPPQVKTAPLGVVIFSAAARRHADRAKRLDDPSEVARFTDVQFMERAGELIDCALAAVLMAYQAVEACTNEIMLAHRLGHAQNMTGFEPKVARQLSEAFDAGADKLNTIEKADLIAIVAGAGPLDHSQGPGQSIRWLHQLRNELVHHKPDWVEASGAGAQSGDALERKLCTLFQTARIWQSRGVPFRWNGCMGGGCAQWACETAMNLNRLVYTAVRAPIPAILG